MTNHNPHTTALPIHAPDQKTKRWAALGVLMLPVLLVSIDNTVLAFAVPAIAKALSPSSAEQLWIVDSYSLVLSALLVPMGAIGDRIGRRKLLLIGSTGFAAISALAAFAPSALMLVVARALLGIFGAMLMPATLSIIRNIFVDATERRIAIAVWASGFSAGAALGPIVGGFLLEHFDWGSVFLLAVPILIPLLILAPIMVPESKDPNPSPVDPLSILLIMTGMTGITFGLTHTSETGFDAVAISTILAGLCFIVLFVLRQLNREKNDIQPMLDVRLFRNTVFTGAITANLISMMVDVGFIYFASQHLQLVSGLPPMYAGMLLIPGTLAIIIAGLVIARVAVHFHPAQVVSFGLALHAAAFAVLAFLGAHNDLVIILIFIVLGTGIGIAQTISNDLMLSSVPPRKAGAASAISETSYETGTVLGTVIIGGMLTAVYRANVVVPDGLDETLADHAHETLGGAVTVASQVGGEQANQLLSSAFAAFDSGVVLSSAFSAVLMGVMAVISYLMIRKAPREMKPAEHYTQNTNIAPVRHGSAARPGLLRKPARAALRYPEVPPRGRRANRRPVMRIFQPAHSRSQVRVVR